VNIKIAEFWDMTFCSSVDIHQATWSYIPEDNDLKFYSNNYEDCLLECDSVHLEILEPNYMVSDPTRLSP
jgi:hypothetical protein